MPTDIRIKRIEAFLLQEISRIVFREFKDPLFENKLLSFSGIKVSRDLAIAHVSVSLLGDDNLLEEIVETLNNAESIIRREIRKISDLRKIPVFVFHCDRTMENAARIDKILDSLNIPPETSEETGSTEEINDLEDKR